MIRATQHMVFALVLLSIPSSLVESQSEDTREVILALQRNRGVHALDAETLQTSGVVVAGAVDRSVGASPDGRTLFIEQASSSGSCCSLFAFDLETRRMCNLGSSNRWVATSDGRLLFTQYSNSGIDVFDARTLIRKPRISVPGGPYTFYASPDSRWLFGISLFRGPSLDLFDTKRRELIHRVALTDGKFPRGVWLKDKFYCIAYDGKQGLLLRKVTPETGAIEPSITVTLDSLADSLGPIWLEAIALGDRLVVYEPFGTKLDRRRDRAKAAGLSGGLFIIDPSSGKAIAHIERSVLFARLVASVDGQWLYGIDSGALDWNGPVRLLKISSRTGEVSMERFLETSVWSIALAKIPTNLALNGEVRPCQDSKP